MDKRDLPLATCTLDWSTMTKAEGGRFCGDCRKVVRDLSRLTEREARALLATPPNEGLCVRYLHDQHGAIFFAGDARERSFVPAAWLSRARRAAVAASLIGPLAACTVSEMSAAASPEAPNAVGSHDPVLSPMMGGALPPDETATPSAADAGTDGAADAALDTDAADPPDLPN